MPEEQNFKNPFSFKEFLEGNTNLLTIFAIFNALIVFSISIEINQLVRDVLTVSFWIFSLLTFLELFLSAIKTYETHKMNISWGLRLKMSFYLYAVAFTQMALIVYFTLLYPIVVGSLIVSALMIGIFLSSVWINLRIDDWIIRSKETKGWSDEKFKIIKKINNWSLLIILILIGLLYFYKSHLN